MNDTNYAYFEWLISQIDIPNNKTYMHLFDRMHTLEFLWTVPNDDNRVQDGLDLRVEFQNESGRRVRIGGATILEVLIGVSRRVAFIMCGEPPKWAWKLIKHLHLHKCADPVSDRAAQKIEDALEALVWRTYERDGTGGFFPLKQALEDQTKVEIWYQMNAYANERYEV